MKGLGMKHRCTGEVFERGYWGGYNEAVDICSEHEDGSFIVENDDGQSSQVNYCPFCGAKAPKQMTVK